MLNINYNITCDNCGNTIYPQRTNNIITFEHPFNWIYHNDNGYMQHFCNIECFKNKYQLKNKEQ
jgi:hypothetical protein